MAITVTPTPPEKYNFAEARLRCTKMMPYLTQHVMSLIPVKKPGLGTMAVDQYMRVYYDPAVLDQWTIDEATVVILHEDLHVVLRHCQRAKQFLPDNPSEQQLFQWNIAADIVVNQILTGAGLKLPKGCVDLKQFGFAANLSVEEYYDLLEQLPKPPQPPQQGSGKGKGQGKGQGQGQQGDGSGKGDGQGDGSGQYNGPQPPQSGAGGGGSGSDGQPKPWEDGAPDKCDTPGLNEHEQHQLERVVAHAMEKHNKSRGTIPGYLARMVEEILRPKTDPAREILAKVKFAIAAAAGRGDYTWRRHSRRQPPGGLRLPAHVRPIPRVAVIVDTSGSMDASDLGLALGVIGRVVRQLPSEGVQVICGDTTMHSAGKVFRPEQLLNASDMPGVALVGGGGTDMGKIVEHVAKGKPRPDVIVVCTDGYTPWPAAPVGPRVVACISREVSEVPDWIEVVEIRPEAITA